MSRKIWRGLTLDTPPTRPFDRYCFGPVELLAVEAWPWSHDSGVGVAGASTTSKAGTIAGVMSSVVCI